MARRPPSAAFDPYVPKPARIFDAFRGGHDNYMADRRAADEVRSWYPGAADLVADDSADPGCSPRPASTPLPVRC